MNDCNYSYTAIPWKTNGRLGGHYMENPWKVPWIFSMEGSMDFPWSPSLYLPGFPCNVLHESMDGWLQSYGNSMENQWKVS